ncbi:MAG: LysM peptidoglycan-binding domain-containing protein [Gammaproteobacteria bacterium]|nr:LysM peptidoglycan-binding domain-containing protein [Gammaproteobacteria bacterium]
MKLVTFIASCFFISTPLYAIPSVEGIQVYQKNIQLSPEHKLKLAADVIRYRNADNLWDVLREEFTLPHYENSPAVQEKIEWFMNNQDFLLRSASRAAPYLYYILQQVKKHHLPAELVLLPIIESGYNPFSRSPVGAAGIWQLMPSTASDWGIKQDWWYDGRRDVIASTRAALNYLAYLQSFFEGNWLLAIAAYDTGEGNVLSAIKRNIRDGRDTDFWSLPVAQETKDYVPSLLALAVIISKPDQYPIYFPLVHNAPYLAQVDIGEQINLKYAASLAGISYKKMMQLNSGFNRPSTSTKGPYKLVLPIENVEQFTENLAHSPIKHQVNWLHYKVKSGDTLASISKRFNTTINDVRKMNHLTKANLRPGTHLLIPHQSMALNDDADNATEIAFNNTKKNEPIKIIKKKSANIITFQTEKTAKSYALQPGDTIYMVRAKDSLESIARHFRVPQLALSRANQLSSSKIKPGRQIIIPSHPELLTQMFLPPVKTKKLKPGDTIYMVRHGDTIEEIARKFHTSPAAVRITNLVDNDSLMEGERLVIPTHLQS